MLKSSSHLPISTANTVLVSTFVVGAVTSGLMHNWFIAILLLAVGIGGLLSAMYARRPNSKDVTRLNAIEYRDERDRLLATSGFAAVGAAALIISVLELVLAAVLFQQLIRLACAQMLALCIVWGVANSAAVKRS